MDKTLKLLKIMSLLMTYVLLTLMFSIGALFIWTGWFNFAFSVGAVIVALIVGAVCAAAAMLDPVMRRRRLRIPVYFIN